MGNQTDQCSRSFGANQRQRGKPFLNIAWKLLSRGSNDEDIRQRRSVKRSFGGMGIRDIMKIEKMTLGKEAVTKLRDERVIDFHRCCPGIK